MIGIPPRAAVEAAERRLNLARHNTRDGLARAGLRFREKITQPLSLAMLVGGAGLLAFWLAPRRRRSKPSAAANGPTRAPSHPILLALAEVSIRALPFALWRMRIAQNKRDDRSQITAQSGSPHRAE